MNLSILECKVVFVGRGRLHQTCMNLSILECKGFYMEETGVTTHSMNLSILECKVVAGSNDQPCEISYESLHIGM